MTARKEKDLSATGALRPPTCAGLRADQIMPIVTIRRSTAVLVVIALCAGLRAGDAKVPSKGIAANSSTQPTSRPTGSSPLTTSASANTDQQEAFAEPYRTIQVATSDMGIIREVLVREGDLVEAEQPLVKLDEELVEASLKIAKQNFASRGAVNSAEAELRLHTSRAEKFDALVRNGNARPEELERTVMEKEVAAARVLTAQETLIVRKLELERIQLELERKFVRSPLKGVVTKVHREVGEFVSATDPVVVTVVQLDPLLATFSLRPVQASQLHAGRAVQVLFASSETPVIAEVEFVSRVTDARSGTVRVKVRIPNSRGTCRSGDRCVLMLSDKTPTSLTSPTAPAVTDPARSAKRTP
ncbi:MAG: efflux RND transporter periplasmic adaptor subunit [Planctomycetia bacterium]|nr:efflux RND transporter periplasmic adaptor subunit [Planctomycetia bacterium]